MTISHGKKKLRKRNPLRCQGALFNYFSFNKQIMRNKILILVLFLFVFTAVNEQQQPDKTKIRIVYTLSKQDRMSRNPVILRAELDSMIQLYNASLPSVQIREPVRETITIIPVWTAV